MKKLILTTALTSILAGCAVFNDDVEEDQIDQSVNMTLTKENSSILKSSNEAHQRAPVKKADVWNVMPKHNISYNKNVNHYARGIMQDLLANLQYVSTTTPIAVADFLYLDSDFSSSTLLGKQLAEALTHEVHKLGIPVVDYKLTDYIRVTPDGDLALSKDYLDLSGDIPIRYILTGTLVEDRNTTIINARIIGVTSKAVVASAQSSIPHAVSIGIEQSNGKDGLY